MIYRFSNKRWPIAIENKADYILFYFSYQEDKAY